MQAYKKSIITLTLVVFFAVLLLHNPYYTKGQAQTSTTFTSADRFTDPTQNSTIAFALNGSYSSAKLQNGSWKFMDLRFDEPKLPYFDLSGIDSVGNLSFSARNCNVTIWIYLKVVYSYPVAIVSYISEGGGTQTVNLGLNNTWPTDKSEWSIVDERGVFFAEGAGWTLLPDDSLLITLPAAGNITVMHFNFNDPEVQKLLPFWIQHSLLLLTGAILGITVTIAVFIKVKKGRKSDAF